MCKKIFIYHLTGLVGVFACELFASMSFKDNVNIYMNILSTFITLLVLKSMSFHFD